MSGAWNFIGDNHESCLEAGQGRETVGMDQPPQGGWRGRQEDPPSPFPSGSGYESYVASTSSYSTARPEQRTPGRHLPPSKRRDQTLSSSSRPRARSQRDTALSSSNRVYKRHIPCNTHTQVKHHENAPPRSPVLSSQLSPPTIVVRPATPTTDIKEIRSIPKFRGSQSHPGSSFSQYRSVRSAPYGVRKSSLKVSNKRFDRGDPFTSCEKSENRELDQTSLLETRGEETQVLEMGLTREKAGGQQGEFR
ncbi:uncharacterized protein EAE97_008431 [Botrytis byssoidea]|uniref:Uncharacterized protein n=1 Tax=Botrytis byssoidea TaxID=139641 RepID=A0A9P5LTB7_9HELO|nr:uncharacterized protein EAE97_008431 [Botrytis byssoidea]KAF7934071.1 hypothetical protein EAE97_008431 [Botrytis byssoidea]